MDGSTFASLAMMLQGASAAQSVGASYYAARNQRRQLESQARIAQINAGIAETNAKTLETAAQDAEYRGQVESMAVRRRADRLKGTQRAAMAKNGIDLTSDTALDVVTSTDILSAEDQQTIRENAVRTAWGYRMEAANARAGGGQQMMAANAANASADGISPGNAAATSLLSGASSVANTWYRTQRGVTIGREA